MPRLSTFDKFVKHTHMGPAGWHYWDTANMFSVSAHTKDAAEQAARLMFNIYWARGAYKEETKP